jgi:phosphate transport system permease protein
VSVTPEVRKAPAAGSVRRGRRRPGERIIELLLVVAAIVSIATTIGIVLSLAVPSVEFFGKVSPADFFGDVRWTPLFADKHYGVWPLLVATLIMSGIAVLIAVPLGLGSAIYLSEYAKPRTRKALKPLLEILAGIPTVVYGFFALLALNPILRDLWPTDNVPDFQNMLAAGIVMGIMIVPTVASLSEDAMSAVPRSLREGAYALASSKMQVSTRVVVPAALSGIVAAIVLGASRALGETMIATIAAGLKSDAIEWDPARTAATMTAYIAGAGQGDLPIESLEYLTIFAVGATLFLFTFGLNVLSIRLVRKFREVYE